MNKAHTSISIVQLRPTQITVGMLQVEHKRKQLRQLEKRPSELIEFILEHPIRVVLGPGEAAYVIDHHHLALALKLEQFETAPMRVAHNFSSLAPASFMKKMQSAGLIHPYDAAGKLKPPRDIPKKLKGLEDDPYRSLAGFVREAGGYEKVETPYAEFVWADFYRSRIKEKMAHKHFSRALKFAIDLAYAPDAAALPGFIKTPVKK
jgi:hypothetical protein